MTVGASGAHPLACIRQLRHWTMHDVAKLIVARSGLNMASWKQKIYRWERQGVIPEMAAQLALAAELGVPVEALERIGWPEWLTLAYPVEATGLPWTVESARTVLGQVVDSVSSDRREIIVYDGSELISMARCWSLSPPPHLPAGLVDSDIGSHAIDVLDRRVADLWALDDQLGAETTLPPALADLRLACTLVMQGAYAPDTVRRLYSLVAAVARFAGWAAFDAGKLSASQRLWHTALRAAHVAVDTGQAAQVLSHLALQSSCHGDSQTATELLELASGQMLPVPDRAGRAADTADSRSTAAIMGLVAGLPAQHRRVPLLLERVGALQAVPDTPNDHVLSGLPGATWHIFPVANVPATITHQTDCRPMLDLQP